MARKTERRVVSHDEAVSLLSPKSALLKMVDGRYKPIPREEALDLLVGHEIRYQESGPPTGMGISLWIRGVCVCYLETASKKQEQRQRKSIKVSKDLAKSLKSRLRAKIDA